jgi:transcriptional regulator with XRE-family HTH domain
VLREFRDQKGKSQEQLAKAAGLDHSLHRLVEHGIHSPNVVLLLKVADVLKVPADLDRQNGIHDARPLASRRASVRGCPNRRRDPGYVGILDRIRLVYARAVRTNTPVGFGSNPFSFRNASGRTPTAD